MKESGQVLLIAVFIGLLLLVAIPVIVLVNTTGIMHHVASAKRDKGTAIAEEGIQYAIQALKDNGPAKWASILAGGGAANYPADCPPTGSALIMGADGGQFKLACSIGTNGAQPYEVRVLSTAYMPDTGQATLVPTRTIQAFLSKKTLAVTLPSGYTASLAARLASPPSVMSSGNLYVGWGPIAVTSNQSWMVQDYTDSLNAGLVGGTPIFGWGPSQMDSKQNPRKFSPANIKGDGNLPAPYAGSQQRSGPYPGPNAGFPVSDNKEYWAWTSLGFSGPVDTATYVTMANASSCPNPPMCGNCAASIPGHCYFPSVGSDTAIFDTGFTVTGSPPVIVVDGNAQIKNVAMDVYPAGAIIVTGNLNLGPATDPTALTPANTPYHIPITAPLEYPYFAGWNQAGNQGQNQMGSENLHGFVYVGQSLTIDTCATNSTPGFWKLMGVLAVDGLLQVKTGSGLILWYDDIANHNVLMPTFALMIDSQNEIATQ